jgi:hypothetical protein
MRDVFISALLSSTPHPSIPEDRRIFEPFVGSWDLVVSWWGEGGSLTRRESGEWHFARVLEGRAIQDVWIVPPCGSRTGDTYEYGTSLRFFDPEIDAWRSTWIGPEHGVVRLFVARRIEDRVVLETKTEDGRAMRWSFSDIRPDGFTWRNEVETDTGWFLQQDFVATRRNEP